VILKILLGERRRFSSLHKRARSLLLSFVAFGVASPLLTLFTNAFLWRQSYDLVSIALYNAFWMAGLAIAFILNGYLLRAVRLAWLYATGLVIQSASCTLLFGLETVGLREVLAIGMVSGMAAGIYWSNRNLLSLQITQGPQRDYFCGVESALGTLLAVLSPAVFGWFLQLGIDEGRLGVVERYRLLAIVTVAVQGLGAWYIVRAGFDDYVPRGFFVWGASSLWNRVRTFTAVKGVAEGSAMFIPTLIILRLVGQEGAVGVTQSLSMVFTSCALYLIAARMKVASRGAVLRLGVGGMVLGGVILSCLYSEAGALAYLFLETLGVQILWVAANPIMLDAINGDQGESADHYRYIVDRELFLNLGRIVGVCVVVILSCASGADTTLRIAPLLLALVTSALPFIIPKLPEAR
jgi:YQGE family putative transporter